MSIVKESVQPLSSGDKLSREEFLRLWDAHPEIKRAELIGGIVYMPSPLSIDHGDKDLDVHGWICLYKSHTHGTAGGANTTTFLLDDSPQPDANLRLLPDFGGRSTVEMRKGKRYLAGIPELFAEICVSSDDHDLHQKLDLYQTVGIPEYLAVLVHEHEIRWHILDNGVYQLSLAPDSDGIHRSRVFPGLWLDGAALLSGDMARVLAKLDEGLRSPGSTRRSWKSWPGIGGLELQRLSTRPYHFTRQHPASAVDILSTAVTVRNRHAHLRREPHRGIHAISSASTTGQLKPPRPDR